MMVHFDRSIAQAIVDRSMQIVQCNVNIMDATGRIIASGERDRIGTLHDGALLVLNGHQRVDINIEAAGALEGSKPGINLPLRLDGKLVGCIGLSGDPGSLDRYAELVRLAAETMLEQAKFLQAMARDARLQEELVLSLVKGEPLTEMRAKWAKYQGYSAEVLRVVALIEIDTPNADRGTVAEEIQKLQTIVMTSPKRYLCAPASPTELIILKPAFNSRQRYDHAAHRNDLESLLAALKKNSTLGLRMSLGRAFPGPDGLKRSYESAQATLCVGKRQSPHSELFFYEDMKLPVLLQAIKNTWATEEIKAIRAALKEDETDGTLMPTVQAWFKNGMKNGDTAHALGVHRNTVVYRMQRVKEKCALDLSTVDGSLLLYMAIMAVPDE
ncbi:sugar diacid recognition domain-containing protein [Agrobacterium salinitolerans]|uniref:sugar diacid recognition domain-containing protein n=1 Tax=Agrobacterium salinitolerans TaxID=1183413 RepID=UPI0015749FD8|nr:sugar diacid recognition domain-containing protein [Agrobacterium salinitolerans]NTA40388.1 carbohydrate diacid regulon transcriptional regulator CdaR [Agrobacterium salinitolerans]